MKFVYMDESGKNIITQPKQQVFIFGGLIIDKSNIYKALEEYKCIYQEARTNLKIVVKQALKQEGVSEKDISLRMQRMFNKFEFHAVKMINRKDISRNGKLIEENPWKYMNESEIFKIINNIFIRMSPYINNIYMFKVDKQPYINYLNAKGVQATDSLCNDDMIEFIVDECNMLLKSENSKGALVPDRLDSYIRDKFVEIINKKNSINLWAEPITVESNTNAFTQVIDIITYFYYKIYINDTNIYNFNGINKAYLKYLKDKIIVKDFLENQIKNTN